MPLIDDVTAEYHRQYPAREGRPAWYPDWLPAFLAVVEKKLSAKIDRLPTAWAEETDPQPSARARQDRAESHE